MKILIVHNILNDSHSVSGVLKYYAFFANEWIAAGHQTDFLAAQAGAPQIAHLAPNSRLVCSDGIFNATRHLSKSWMNMPAYAYRLATAHAVRLPERYDVVYASGPFIFEVYPAMVISRRLRCVWTAKVQHVLASQGTRRSIYDRLYLWAERQSVRWINRRAAMLLCLSNTVAKDYRCLEESLGLTPKESVVVGCGIDVRAFENVPQGPKEFDAVFLGRLHEHKGIFDLPAMWQLVRAAIPTAKLVIIGEGPHRSRLESMLGELAGSVTFTGGIPEPEKNRVLAQARIGISLSYEEGWGLAVNEFLASALPVVAYDLPVFREVFPERLVTVPKGSTDLFAKAVVELLRDESRRKVLGEAGRQFIQQYDFRSLAGKELAALERVVGKG